MQTCPHCQRQTHYGCTRKICELKQSEATKAHLASHFTPGNVIFVDYWSLYDLVLAFHPTTAARDWTVTVIGCDSDGVPMVGERSREHCTYPDKRDRITLTDYRINY